MKSKGEMKAFLNYRYFAFVSVYSMINFGVITESVLEKFLNTYFNNDKEELVDANSYKKQKNNK